MRLSEPLLKFRSVKEFRVSSLSRRLWRSFPVVLLVEKEFCLARFSSLCGALSVRGQRSSAVENLQRSRVAPLVPRIHRLSVSASAASSFFVHSEQVLQVTAEFVSSVNGSSADCVCVEREPDWLTPLISWGGGERVPAEGEERRGKGTRLPYCCSILPRMQSRVRLVREVDALRDYQPRPKREQPTKFRGS